MCWCLVMPWISKRDQHLVWNISSLWENNSTPFTFTLSILGDLNLSFRNTFIHFLLFMFLLQWGRDCVFGWLISFKYRFIKSSSLTCSLIITYQVISSCLTIWFFEDKSTYLSTYINAKRVVDFGTPWKLRNATLNN